MYFFDHIFNFQFLVHFSDVRHKTQDTGILLRPIKVSLDKPDVKIKRTTSEKYQTKYP